MIIAFGIGFLSGILAFVLIRNVRYTMLKRADGLVREIERTSVRIQPATEPDLFVISREVEWDSAVERRTIFFPINCIPELMSQLSGMRADRYRRMREKIETLQEQMSKESMYFGLDAEPVDALATQIDGLNARDKINL